MTVEGKWFMRMVGTVLIGCITLMGGNLAAGESPSVAMIKDGVSACSIVVDPNGAKSARFAACELQWHIKKMTGADIPIVSAPETQTRKFLIYVGDSPALKSAEGFSTMDFKPQEYIVSVKPGRIILAGKDSDDKGAFTYNMDDPAKIAGVPDLWKSNGSLYAVYDFLERHCGVRWFNQTESGTFIPDMKNLSIACGELRRMPAFIYRNACYPSNPKSSDSYNHYISLWKSDTPQYKEWDAMAYPSLHGKYSDDKQYTNARGNLAGLYLLRNRCGGERMDCNHSFYGYYDRFWEKNPKNPQVFEGSRPEYFAKGYDPKSLPPNLCYTNPELIKQVARDAVEYYDGKKTGQELSIFYCPTLPNPFPVEPMDGGGFCKCDNCAKLIKTQDERGRAGIHSDYFFNFVNEVCKELRKTHPDKSVITLAYMTHARIPSFKLDPGVNVQYCFTSNRLPYDINSYESQLANLAEWGEEKKISGRQLGLWLYYTFPVEGARNGGFNCFPGFFAHTIAKQMKLFQKYGIYGMFHCGYGQEVEAYVTFRMMNDPSLDIDALLNEYFTRMYGNAAKPMKELYNRIEETYSNPENYFSKVKVFDILDKGSGDTAPFKASDLKAAGICVTQDVNEKWKDRISRFANISVCTINKDGSDGEELLKENFNGNPQSEWLSDSNFKQGKEGNRNFMELPWNAKMGIAVGKLQKQSSGNGIRIKWDHLADGWDFFRQWHVILATEASLNSLSGYDVTYRRNGHDAKPYMDILKITDAFPNSNSGSLFKLYGDEKISSWAVTPAKDAKPSSLMTDQAMIKGEWTRFQLDVTQEENGMRLRLYRQNADPDLKKSIGHQTAQIAWGVLGTEERMEEFGRFMAEAEKLASTELEKQRVALFKKSVWEYMSTGAAQYRERTKAAIPSLKATEIQDVNGDANAVDWSKAATLGEAWFKKGSDQRSDKKLSGKICHDKQFLYLELRDKCDTSKLITSPEIFPYDDWEIYIALQKALPYRQYAVSPSGKLLGLSHGEVNFRMNVPLDENRVKTLSDTSLPDRWTLRLAFPLDSMTNGVLKKGDKFYMNVTRISSPSLANGCDIDSWVSFCTVKEADRLAEITLE